MSAYTQFDGVFHEVAGGYRYTASKDLEWRIGNAETGPLMTVPALYEHDVSIPFLLRGAFDRRDKRFQCAARVHDWMLDCGFDRITAAGAFNSALAAYDVPFAKRFLMTFAVALYRFQ